MALGVIDAAREVRTRGLDGLLIVGYENQRHGDDQEAILPYVQGGSVAVTIDQLLDTPHIGMTHTVKARPCCLVPPPPSCRRNPLRPRAGATSRPFIEPAAHISPPRGAPSGG